MRRSDVAEWSGEAMSEYASVMLLAMVFAVALAWMGDNPYSNDDANE